MSSPPSALALSDDIRALMEALRGLSDTDICARFGMQRQLNGCFMPPAAAPPYILLPVGECLAWQKIDADIDFVYVAGAPLALSWSEDGNHASAIHMGNTLPHHLPAQRLAKQVWHTAESLGAWSVMALIGLRADSPIEAAPVDWFPTPMAAPLGQA